MLALSSSRPRGFAINLSKVYNINLTGVVIAENIELAPQRAAVLHFAASQIGTPSIRFDPRHPEYGADPEKGFDCRGLIRYVFEQAGIDPGQYSDRNGNIVPINFSREYADHYGVWTQVPYVKPADLALMSRVGFMPDHIAIVESVDPITGIVKVIHSPGTFVKLVERAEFNMNDPTPCPDMIPDKETRRYATHVIGFKALSLDY